MDYAREVLAKLITEYPDAYIFEQNNFHKIRIPDIISEDKGLVIIKDIKNRFNLTPLLVKKTN